MDKPTVYAVMKATIEIPVRGSSPAESFEQMYRAAKSEAEDLLRTKLQGTGCRVIGNVEFAHAVVKGGA